MSVSSVATLMSSENAEEALKSFLREQRESKEPGVFAEFERELRARMAAVERQYFAEHLARFDLNVPRLKVDGVTYRQVLRHPGVYCTLAGEVRVERSLYVKGESGEKAISALECRAGIVEGYFSPEAAKLGVWVTAHLTPQEGEALFERLGGMTPSKASLDRLPKGVSEHWEASREQFEQVLLDEAKLPATATAISVSLDGVLVPMKEARGAEKRRKASEDGKSPKGPNGYREVGCATLSFYDREGTRLSTVKMARMPEKGKATLKRQLKAELESVLKLRPGLQLVKLADGARDNWTYLSEVLPEGIELVDFYHVAEHLKVALDAAFGEGSQESKAQFENLRHELRHDEQGVDKVIQALRKLKREHPRRQKIATELNYFLHNRSRMQYATVAKVNLPIGSGVVEAACKTLATQRLKRSGMRWGHNGGQAILTWRALIQSERFDRAWTLVAATWKRRIELPDNVIPLRSTRRRATSI